jgi:DNA-binding NarL/FixJ family response regulator
VPELSREDLELLALIASGVTAEVAAQRLRLSSRALRRHLRSICDQLGVGSRMEAVVWAAHRRLI